MRFLDNPIVALIVFYGFWMLIYAYMDGLESSPGIVKIVGYSGLGYFFWKWYKNSS